MISKWKYNYTDEEKGMALTIQNKNQEIGKLVDELEEQERHIKETDFQIERLNNIINELEKDMIFDMNDYGKDLDIQTGNIYSEYHRGYCQNGKDYYDKLQELKGDKNNDN